MNFTRTILDLCGGTGSWSQPYADAGYDVRIVTLPEMDVWMYEPPERVHGILAAPPCDHLAGSGAQYWPAKDADGRTREALGIVSACCRIILACQPRGLKWWSMEQPVGRLVRWMGPYRMTFNPCDYGDPYTKRTCLWGDFNVPAKTPVEPERVCSQGSWIQKLGGKSARTKMLRSKTPPGFAMAFFRANP